MRSASRLRQDDHEAVLARRVQRWLFAYPADVRRVRGPEIVATLLELARPAQRWPNPADLADLVAGGLRSRFRWWPADALDDGLVRAAPIALILVAGTAGFLWLRVDAAGHTSMLHPRTPAPASYVLWLAASLAYAGGRHTLTRLLAGMASLTLVATPLVATLAGMTRPPGWVLMSFTAFGLIVLAGTSPAAGATHPRDLGSRLLVPAATAAVTVGLSRIAAVANGGRPPSYYQPTLTLVGLVSAVAVGGTAVAGLHLAWQGRSAAGWPLATLALGLPGGWLGPTWSQWSSAFGRLAEVVLATSMVFGATAWRVRRSLPDPSWPAGPAGLAIGFCAGYLGFLAVTRSGSIPRLADVAGLAGALAWTFLPSGWGRGAALLVGTAMAAGAAATLVHGRDARASGTAAGLLAIAAGAGRAGPVIRRLRWVGMGAATTFLVAWVIAWYDNGWRLTDSPAPTTAGLVSCTALLVFGACGLWAAAQLVAAGRPTGRSGPAVVLCIAATWYAVTALPSVTRWGAVPIVLVASLLAWLVARLHRPPARLSSPPGVPAAGAPVD